MTELEQTLDEESSLQKVSRLGNKVLDLYYRPKEFEKSGRLYEALGVRTFSKYCPNGGSYWNKLLKRKIFKKRSKSLNHFTIETKIKEAAHVAFLPFYTHLTTEFLSVDDYLNAAIITILNIGINVYPIMSQRYNRNRALNLIDRLEN